MSPQSPDSHVPPIQAGTGPACGPPDHAGPSTSCERARHWQRQLLRGARSAAGALCIKLDTVVVACTPADGSTCADLLRGQAATQKSQWTLFAGSPAPDSAPAGPMMMLHPPAGGIAALPSLLTKLSSEAVKAEAETGAIGLYLCIGLVRRPDDGSANSSDGGPAKAPPAQTPVWLVPVRLQATAGAPGLGWTLNTSAGAAQLNPAVVELLQRQWGLQLPAFSGQDAAEQMMQWIHDALPTDSGWTLLDRIVLAHLPWSQAALWQDLQARQNLLRHNPVVAHLLDHPGKAMPTATTTGDAKADPDEPSRWLPTVLDADPSQRRVLAAADRGQSLVVHGPPGTGKSQTLANLIGRAMGRGKRVLFVTEKREAMDVVYARLCELGLDTWTLTMPDATSTRTDFFEQLQASLNAAQDANTEAHDTTDEVDQSALAQAAADLESLHQALQHRSATGFTLHEAMATGLQAEWPDIAMPGIDPQAHRLSEVTGLHVTAQRLVSLGECFEEQGVALATHPLRAVSDPGMAATVEQHQLQATKTRLALQHLLAVLPDWLCRLGLGTVNPIHLRLGAVSTLCRLAECAASAPPGSGPLLPHALNRAALFAWRAANQHDHRREQLQQRLPLAFVPDVCLVSAATLTAPWTRANRRWGMGRWWARRRVLRSLAAYARPGHTLTAADVTALLEALPPLKHDEQRSHQLRADLPWATPLEGDEPACLGWMGELQDLATQARALMNPGASASDDWDSLLLNWMHGFSNLDALATLQQSTRACEVLHNAARSSADTPAGLIGNPTLAQLQGDCAVWLDYQALWPAWLRWVSLRNEAIDHGLGGLVDALQDGRLNLEDAAAGFETAYRRWWAQAVQARPPAAVARGVCVLRDAGQQGQQTSVQALVDALGDTLARARASARRRAQSAAALKAHAALQSDTPDAQLGYLKRALQRRRGRPLPRQVIQACAPLLLDFKPVWMMSPLSAAQLLGPGHPGFDMVLIDEASQMPLWRAVGAMSRAPQALIFGDPQQMPPADYFAARTDALGHGSADSGAPGLVELDSVLDEALAICLPQLSLDTHYRSRHECLIAFSNQHFYGSRLSTRPSPALAHDAIQLVQLSDGHYGRGTSRDNLREAQAVVDAIAAHVLNPRTASQSLGVVTMNQPQQVLVQRLLDQLCRKDAALDGALQRLAQAGQPLFVRNLESVQGDERDWVFLSVTYSAMPEGERTALNFGPLNQVGGARRLNVAVSRAREGMVVFSSLRPQDLPREADNAGVRALRAFLEHVQRHAGQVQALAEAGPATRLGPFETWIKRGLQARGWQVHGPLGRCPAERIDLAVVDPQQPGRYLVALLSDGGSAACGHDVVDREVGRVARLRALGWQVRQLRLPEFVADPKTELDALDAFVRACLDRPAEWGRFSSQPEHRLEPS